MRIRFCAVEVCASRVTESASIFSRWRMSPPPRFHTSIRANGAG